MSGCSSNIIDPNSVISPEKVFSAPTDFRTRSGRTSRMSTLAISNSGARPCLPEVGRMNSAGLVSHVEAGE